MKNYLLCRSMSLLDPQAPTPLLDLVCVDDPAFDFEEALRKRIWEYFSEQEGHFSPGGLFSGSPLSTPEPSRSPSPELADGTLSFEKQASCSSLDLEALSTANGSPACKAGGSKTRNKQRAHEKRKKKRRSRKLSKPGQLPNPQIQPSFTAKHLDSALNVQTDLTTETLSATSTAFVAKKGPSGKRVYTVEGLIGKGAKVPFKLIEWDGMYV
jgi:hypothetical protein